MSDNKDILNDILNDTAENDAAELEEALETADELDEAEESNFRQVYQEAVNELPEENEPQQRYYQQERYTQAERSVRSMNQTPPPRRKKKKKKKKRKASRLPGVLILVTLIFGISTILSLVIISYGKDMLGIGKSEETHVIVIPDGATDLEVSQMLFENNIIKSAKAFELFAGLGDEKN